MDRTSSKEQPGTSACVPSWYNRKEFASSHTNIRSPLYAEGIAALCTLGARLFMQGQALHFCFFVKGMYASSRATWIEATLGVPSPDSRSQSTTARYPRCTTTRLHLYMATIEATIRRVDQECLSKQPQGETQMPTFRFNGQPRDRSRWLYGNTHVTVSELNKELYNQEASS